MTITSTICRISGCKKPRVKNRSLCRIHLNEYNRQWNCRNSQRRREQVRNHNLLRHYGITAAEYDEMFAKQKGLCALCHSPERARNRDGSLKRLAVDHCHLSGQIRELLCYECNTLLAKAEDDVEILKLAISYLRKHQRKLMRAV